MNRKLFAHLFTALCILIPGFARADSGPLYVRYQIINLGVQ